MVVNEAHSPNPRLQRTRSAAPPSPLSRQALGASLNRLSLVVLALGVVLSGCRSRDGLRHGLVDGLSPDLVVVQPGVPARSVRYPGYERLVYPVEVAYPAAAVITVISETLTRHGYHPLRNNWYNRDEASEYVRGWDHSTVVDRPGGKEKYLCRWWAQWRNPQGDIVDYALLYLSKGEMFTNKTFLEVSATRMSKSVAERLTSARARTLPVVELPTGTPPNAETATDNLPAVRSFRASPNGA
jgi:hypothetical protein